MNKDTHKSALNETYCEALANFPLSSQSFILSEKLKELNLKIIGNKIDIDII